jgi:hypothetical protein
VGTVDLYRNGVTVVSIDNDNNRVEIVSDE